MKVLKDSFWLDIIKKANKRLKKKLTKNAKIFQKKKNKRGDSMDVKDTKISLKMKKKNYFIIEEDHTKN